jgi:tetratricopeptide (TPR) repeat protein
MQQYRFNYPLFIGLIVGTLVCSVGIYGLWRFQLGRKSGWLLSEATKASDEKDHREAVRYYAQYLTIRPRDEDVRIQYAIANADMSQLRDVNNDEFISAVRVLEATVTGNLQDRPETKKLRRRLVEIYGGENFRRFQDAMDHLSYLLEQDPNDADLLALKAAYMARTGSIDDAISFSYDLIGYDPKTDEFDVKKAKTPNHVEVYRNLASALNGQGNNPDLAARVMDEMVEANPKSADAYLARAGYQLALDSPEEARADAEKAYELDPKKANVLLFMTDLEARDEDYDKAQEYIATGKKLYPEDVRFYLAAAGLQLKQENYEAAIAALDEGLKVIKGEEAFQLMAVKLDQQINRNELTAARQTIGDVQSKFPNIRSELVDYYNARIILAEGKWHAAAAALSKLRPKLAEMGGGRTMEVDFNLGLCYEKMGMPDLAIESYQLVLQQDPKNAPALAGVERATAQRGLERSDGKEDPIAEAFAIEMKKPKSERDINKLTKMLEEIAKDKEWEPAVLKVQQARLMIMDEKFDGARKLLKEANDLAPKNLMIHRMMVQLARLDPKVGPEKSLELLDKVVAQFDDQPALRLDKADILIALKGGEPNKDELKSELAVLFAGMDDWTPQQKAELWSGMAQRYLQLGMTDDARQYLRFSADSQPNDLPTRLSLFALALEANDDAGMKDAQDKILEIVGDQGHNAWLYTEARRNLSLIRRGQLKPEAVADIRKLVNRALEQRPTWHELHVLNAELELQAGNLRKALEHFDRAQELGRPYPAAIAQHIKLLAMDGRFQQAGELLERLAEPVRFGLLGQLYPEILFRTNRVDEALKQAKAAIELNPEAAQNHYWYSQLLARSAYKSRAEAAAANQAAPGGGDRLTTQPNIDKAIMGQAIDEMREAVKLQPEFMEAWFALISYYQLLGEPENAQGALREAQLVLSGDNLQSFLARSYEALGRWFDAETMYRAVYEAAPDDLSKTQQLAAFYLGNVYQRPDRNLKVTPLLNKLLKAGADKKLPPNDPNLLWARRNAAKMLAETGDYQNLLKAEKLLTSNSKDGELTIDDKLALAEILAGRPEPRSKGKAIALIEDVGRVQPLNENSEIALARLYFETAEDWRKYSSQMEKAIARFPNSMPARAAYVGNLINRGDQRSLEKAATHVTKLRQLAPNNITTFGLTVRLANKMGKQAAARAELLKGLPDLSKIKELRPQDIQMLTLFASLLVELEDLDSAERLHREMAARDVNQTTALAMFLGLHRSVEQCFEKLNEIYTPERIPAVLQVALGVVRRQRDKVGDKFDEPIQRWLETGLRENPDSITLLMDQADFYDMQKRYDDSANVYRKLLERKDLTGLRRAIVLNNLSFLVALAGSKAGVDDDPMALVEEAADIMGPNSDILDTRAIVHISKGQYKDAVQDLELSVTDNPTASKYFHKAQAHLMAGQNRDAIDAWEKAEGFGLDLDEINLMEHEIYKELKTKIDRLRGSSVTQADGLRRAG